MKSTINREKQNHANQSVPHSFAVNKFIAVLLVLIMIVGCLSGCKKTVVETEANTENANKSSNAIGTSQIMNVGYSEDDCFNPYFMTTDINAGLVSLVFESLFITDETFKAVPDLADSYSIDKTKMSVKLDMSAAFSDGTQISSADVVYSFNLAKKSDIYSAELSDISDAQSADISVVNFTITGNFSSAADALIFPVVKSSSAANSSSLPIGTGLYKYVGAAPNISMDYNPYCRTTEPNIKKINLVRISPSSTLIHTLETGMIDAYFDDFSTGSYAQTKSSTAKTNLPNLIFVGINSSSYALTLPAVRQAIFYGINRQAVVRNAYKNYAVESYMPFHPQWHVAEESGYDTSSLTLDYSKAQSLLKSAGVNGTLNYRMIVYSGNNFKVAAANEIKTSLASLGINVIVSALTWDDYIETLSEGGYDLFLGEVKLPANMEMNALFGENSILSGVALNDTTGEAFKEFRAGNISITSFSESFLQNMPIAPVCFRLGALFYSDAISPAASCSYSDVYNNINEWILEKTAEPSTD